MDNYRIDLCKYRLSQAHQYLTSSKVLLETNDYKSAANRAYYCIYQSIRSVIALEGVEYKKHMGNISHFREKYIKTKIFDVELSDIISDAFTIRNSSDYDDFYIISKEDTMKQIENAEKFFNAVNLYVKVELQDEI